MADQENFRICEKMRIVSRTLLFKKPARTSRDTLLKREVYYILLEVDGCTGIGEAAPIYGLSPETAESMRAFLENVRETEARTLPDNLRKIAPSLVMALETAQLDLRSGGRRQLFPLAEGLRIPVNGLVWMNEISDMLTEARQKIEAGFTTIKFKVGALNFEDELGLLRTIRREYGNELTIRLDANGAFAPAEALEKIKRLSDYHIHSIEQPIRQGQREQVAELCAHSPVAIALDEELIGIDDPRDKRELLEEVRPAYLVLKPTLHGAFSGCDEWIEVADSMGIAWWATSALESNLGLNAIAQWLAQKDHSIPQGLGTGMLYENNIPAPMRMENGFFFWDHQREWDLKEILG